MALQQIYVMQLFAFLVEIALTSLLLVDRTLNVYVNQATLEYIAKPVSNNVIETISPVYYSATFL